MKYITKNDKEYFNGLKKYISFLLILFVLSSFYGAVSEHLTEKDIILNTDGGEYNGKERTIEKIENTYKNSTSLKIESDFGKTIDIFINNAYIDIVLILFGMTIFLSIAVITNNGVFLGSAIYLLYSNFGYIPVIAIIPHGIIEIPLLIITSAIFFKVGWKTFLLSKNMIHEKPKLNTIEDVYNCFWKYIFKETYLGLKFWIKFILPLLILSAFIEIYASGRIASFIFTGNW